MASWSLVAARSGVGREGVTQSADVCGAGVWASHPAGFPSGMLAVGGVTVLGGSAGGHIHSDEQGTPVSEDFRWM